MRVTIHTPQVIEDVWQIPDVDAVGITDAEILAIVRTHALSPNGGGPRDVRRTAARVFEVREPFVFSRGETDLESIGRRLADARAMVDRVMEEAKAAALPRLEERSVSERKAAADLGVDRNTVRAWRGVAPRGGPARDIAASG